MNSSNNSVFNNELKFGLGRQNSDNQSKAVNVTVEKISLISVRYCLILSSF
jgi:hypothetical protein